MIDSTHRSPSSDNGLESAASAAAPELHRFAILAAAATFILIFVGGLVTSTGSALAVPDWPLAFGRLIPRTFAGGIRFEYGHRVVAGVVAVLTLVLALWIWRAERRTWLRYTALGAFGLIIVQAVIGGITVLFDLPLAVAVAHAGIAQAFFCVMVSLAVFTNPGWIGMRAEGGSSGHPHLPLLAAATAAAVYLQILIGALVRHMGAGLAIPDFPLNFGHLIPPLMDERIAVNFAHRCGALVVTVLILWTAAWVLSAYSEHPSLRRPALGLIGLLALQIALGALTVWSRRAVLPTTAHVAVGAAVLATAVVLTLRLYRLEALKRSPRPAASVLRGEALESKVTA